MCHVTRIKAHGTHLVGWWEFFSLALAGRETVKIQLCQWQLLAYICKAFSDWPQSWLLVISYGRAGVPTSCGFKQHSERDSLLPMGIPVKMAHKMGDKMSAIHSSSLGLLMVQGILFTFSNHRAT